MVHVFSWWKRETVNNYFIIQYKATGHHSFKEENSQREFLPRTRPAIRIRMNDYPNTCFQLVYFQRYKYIGWNTKQNTITLRKLCRKDMHIMTGWVTTINIFGSQSPFCDNTNSMYIFSLASTTFVQYYWLTFLLSLSISHPGPHIFFSSTLFSSASGTAWHIF